MAAIAQSVAAAATLLASLSLDAADPFARDMLAAHNTVRAGIGVPALAWSDKLASASRQWAQTLLEGRRFAHQPDSPYGENLFQITGAEATPAEVVAAWASEAANYDYRSNSCREGVCGHYTQLVWRNTREVGCGVARAAGREIVVCKYNPPGNYRGQRPY